MKITDPVATVRPVGALQTCLLVVLLSINIHKTLNHRRSCFI